MESSYDGQAIDSAKTGHTKFETNSFVEFTLYEQMYGRLIRGDDLSVDMICLPYNAAKSIVITNTCIYAIS